MRNVLLDSSVERYDSSRNMLTIRPAVEADAGVVASLIRGSFLAQVDILGIRESEYPNYVGFETASSVQRRMSAAVHVALASLGGQCIGTISCAPDVHDPRLGDISAWGWCRRRADEATGVSSWIMRKRS